MNKKYFFLTTLSFLFLFFVKNYAKLRAKRQQLSNEYDENSLYPKEMELISVIQEDSSNTFTLNPPKNNNEEQLQAEETKNIRNITVNLHGNDCLVIPDEGVNFKAENNGQTIYTANGKIIVNDEKTDGFEMLSLELLTEVTCGIENYDQISYCAKVKFFNSEEINPVNKELFKPNNPTNINEYLKNYMQDFALVLIEGCVLCENKTKPINIIFRQIHKELRGLKINLIKEKEEIFDWDWEDKLKGLGYTYYSAISPDEFKKLEKANESKITVKDLEDNEHFLAGDKEEENMDNEDENKKEEISEGGEKNEEMIEDDEKNEENKLEESTMKMMIEEKKEEEKSKEKN
uniref:Uncharacterized protein n=1 Tax=Meloidogyne hapla TaxID=6305 RepID=A0A1I8BFP2_MELHA